MAQDLDKYESSRFSRVRSLLRELLTPDRARAYLNAVAGAIPILGAIAQIVEYELSARPSAENQVRLEQRLTEVAKMVAELNVQVRADYVRTDEFTDLWLGIRSV